jgi:hypothetical protein
VGSLKEKYLTSLLVTPGVGSLKEKYLTSLLVTPGVGSLKEKYLTSLLVTCWVWKLLGGVLLKKAGELPFGNSLWRLLGVGC